MAQCFYCNADAKLTKAPLLQKEIRHSVKFQESQVSLAASSARSGGAYRDVLHNGDIRDAKVTSLCSICNNIWMNRIELAAAPIFKSIMSGEGAPPPAGLFKLAHWAVVVGALTSALFPQLTIPVEHRRAIRQTRTGQPRDFSTHFIWTDDYLPGFMFDIYRLEADSLEEPVRWYSVMHAGRLATISGSPFVGYRISEVLRDANIHGILGAFSSNIAYAPTRSGVSPSTSLALPSHATVKQLHPEIGAPGARYAKTRGSLVLDFEGIAVSDASMTAFDYGDSLTDVRDHLDLSYLDGAFG